MIGSSSLHNRKALFCIVFLVVFSSFTADILDLREDIGILSCPYSSLDNNITTGVASDITLEMDPVFLPCFDHQKSSVTISFLHLLPCGYRAPPPWS
jgi:hypothetical protein